MYGMDHLGIECHMHVFLKLHYVVKGKLTERSCAIVSGGGGSGVTEV